MSTKKSEYQKVTPARQHAPFEFIVIIENSETDLFIHSTLVNTLSLGNRVERRKNPDDFLKELSSVKRLDEIPDLILLSLQLSEPKNFDFLDKFNELPDMIRAKCKLIIVTSANSKEEKIKAIMNPSVIRYLEKPIDVVNFKDFMYM